MKRPNQPQSAPEFFSPQVSGARRFYLNLNPAKRAPLSVVCGGCEHCAPDYKIHRPTFPFYSIEYVVRGCVSLKLQNRRHALQPGGVFSYGPGVRQDIVADPAEPPVKYFVNFAGLKSREILRRCHLPPGSVSQIFPPNEIQDLFDELIRCGQRGGRQSAELCAKLLECLVLKMSESRAPRAGVESLSFTTYQHCRRHIEENFQRLKTLGQIAQECHVDDAYLCRLFQRYDHQSPYQFLIRLKMNLSAEWLQQPGALVKQVAERAGFSDQFHFSRAFKSVFGVAPDIFRRLR
jgi:AraC-like DNA-binding protein/quercetin dioxygenase-like cupin family protein